MPPETGNPVMKFEPVKLPELEIFKFKFNRVSLRKGGSGNNKKCLKIQGIIICN